MVDYVKLAATTVRLITKNGKTISLKKLSTTAADPAKPWRGPADGRAPYALEKDCKAVEVGTSTRVSDYGGMISKSDIPDTVTDIFLVAPPADASELDDFDELLCDGTMYHIEKIIRLKPGAIVLLYVIGVSR